MARLVFRAADVRRVVEHSLAAPVQREHAVDFDAKTGKMIMKPVEAPAVILVHDQGVYLMSNGTPGDALVPGTTGKYFKHHVAYAKDCDPAKDGEWWDNARDLVGGDDFSETLPWAQQIKDVLDRGAKTITINFGKSKISIAA